jgi:hypothetical protein
VRILWGIPEARHSWCILPWQVDHAWYIGIYTSNICGLMWWLYFRIL